MGDAPATESNVREVPIDEDLKESYLTYAMSVIVSRALPDVRDGLKPSQRRVLVAMNQLNLGPRASRVKCALICGTTSGNYHPHGEQVVYPTLVRMAQDFSMRYTLVDPQGNFGSIDGFPAAAMRYTEARMSPLAVEMLDDLQRDTVDMVPNYDARLSEPVVLPGKFPNLLANGASGIAVGMATSIPPHNLGEIADAVVALIDDPDITVEGLMKHIPAPDFPTGGIICGRAGIRRAYRTGHGKLVVRSRVHVETADSGKKTIVITEIPYQITKETLVKRIAQAARDKVVRGIADVQDHSDREGLRIAVELQRGEDENVVLNQLYQRTPMQSSFSIQMIALVGGRPRTLGLKEMLECFRDHRVVVIRRRTEHLLRLARERSHILEGLLVALENIDAVIGTIRASKDVPAAREALQRKFGLSERQATAILEMRLQRLTGLERDAVQNEYDELREKIKGYVAILSDASAVLDIIREDVFELKEKYGDPRRTQVTGSVEEFSIEDLIAEEQMAVSITHAGYIKRQPLSSYRSQHRGGKGVMGMRVKEEDVIESLFVASTHDYILFFTDKGKVHWLKVYDIPQLGRASKGRAVVNVLRLGRDEHVTAAIPVREFDDEHYVVMATARGVIKKTALSSFGHPRRGGIIAANLKKDDRLVGCTVTDGSYELILATRNGMAARFAESNVRAMGRSAAGVRGIRLKKGDEVVALVRPAAGLKVLTVCQNGYGKRSAVGDYRLIKRGGQGVININTSERNGPVVSCMAVAEDDEVMAITGAGQVVRMPVRQIRVTGRAAQGVRVVSFKAEGDTLVMLATVPREEAEPPGAEAAPDEAADEPPGEGADADEPDSDETGEEDGAGDDEPGDEDDDDGDGAGK